MKATLPSPWGRGIGMRWRKWGVPADRELPTTAAGPTEGNPIGMQINNCKNENVTNQVYVIEDAGGSR
jgi:hypothetical protein